MGRTSCLVRFVEVKILFHCRIHTSRTVHAVGGTLACNQCRHVHARMDRRLRCMHGPVRTDNERENVRKEGKRRAEGGEREREVEGREGGRERGGGREGAGRGRKEGRERERERGGGGGGVKTRTETFIFSICH